ncbi:MAG: hypothetical protein KC933_42080, partial [Myxococcales bacterium]|nr:hypothetical protein [Myxococcales bacterium]
MPQPQQPQHAWRGAQHGSARVGSQQAAAGGQAQHAASVEGSLGEQEHGAQHGLGFLGSIIDL